MFLAFSGFPAIILLLSSANLSSATFAGRFLTVSIIFTLNKASGIYAKKMKHLIIDTDGVSDDLRAISLAVHHPKAYILGITTVHGCAKAEQAVANVARLQRAMGIYKKIPIYMGAKSAIIAKPFVVNSFFGKDGIGDRPDVYPRALPSDFKAHEDETAVLALIRLTKEYKDVIIVALAPLTNIALAYKLDPSFAKRIKKIVILGGNYFGIGNVNGMSSAEFNFHADPEAAKIVLEEMDTDITFVPWDTFHLKSAEHEAQTDFHAHLRVGTPLASFLAAATHLGRQIMAKSGRQYGYCDEVAVAAALDPQAVVKKSIDLKVGVELQGEMTRGQVVVDWSNVRFYRNGSGVDTSTDKRRKVHVVVDYNVKLVDENMRNVVSL